MEYSAESFFLSCFSGFGIYSVVYLVLHIFFKEKRARFEEFDRSASHLISFIAIGFVIWALFAEKPFFYYCYYVIPIQLLWWPKIRTYLPGRAFIGILALLSPGRLITFLTSFHRDYLPSTWHIPFTNQLVLLTVGPLLFGTMAFVFHRIRTRTITRKIS